MHWKKSRAYSSTHIGRKHERFEKPKDPPNIEFNGKCPMK